MSVSTGTGICKVVPVREMLTWKRHRAGFVALPLAMLGFFLIQIVLLPAHGLPAHDAVMSATAASQAEHSSNAQHSTQGAGDRNGGHEHADQGHGPSEGAPSCHAAAHFGEAFPARSWEDDLPKLGLGILLVASALVSLALPRWSSRLRQWWSRPPWRPAGTDLLIHVCIART